MATLPGSNNYKSDIEVRKEAKGSVLYANQAAETSRGL